MKFYSLALLFVHFLLSPIEAQVPSPKPLVKKFCDKLEEKFKGLGWSKSNCDQVAWEQVRTSVKGDPLIWTTYGAKEGTPDVDVTLILCGVHGDEITPVKFCFDIMEHLKQNPTEFAQKLIVVVPIVNPDSFFIKRPTRVNARGVDINRNFPTSDWNKNALTFWKNRYKSDKRRYPGKKAMSEPEVVFQVNLIKRYKPKKILTVHAPLTLIDYDGPTSTGNKGQELLIQMSQKVKGYKVQSYPFFPGSLGNYAGNENNIPTYTIELPSSDPAKSGEYWDMFKEAINSAILHDITQSPEP
jgi:murein peptide amidase A